MPHRSASADASDFAQTMREFTDVIRALRPEDLTDAERALLRSLLNQLNALADVVERTAQH
jgi:hypothetical protein